MDGKSGDANNEEIRTIETETIETDTQNNADTETDAEISLTGDSASFGEIFKNLGGLEKIGTLGADLYEGLHSLTDGFYVDGQAPTSEWQSKSQMMRQNIKESSEKRKENMDRAKNNWANNKENISVMSNKYYNEKYLPEMTKKYEGQLKSGKVDMNYVQAQAREKADEKAKKDLKDLSEYVPYGVTDVNVAYELYDNANKNGFSPEQSVRNMAGYAKFNLSAGNITHVNQSGIYERNDYKSVQAAIPDAKTYYDAGYTKVNEMEWLDSMAQKLGKDPAFAMKVDEALKKKVKGGKLSYNGKDAEMKKVIDQINSHYGG